MAQRTLGYSRWTIGLIDANGYVNQHEYAAPLTVISFLLQKVTEIKEDADLPDSTKAKEFSKALNYYRSYMAKCSRNAYEGMYTVLPGVI